MIFEVFSSGITLENLLTFALLVPALLFALTFHEYAHGFAAYKQGDNFAKNTGRLSLNPLKHLDPLGFICLLAAGFGWAKPVPVVPGNFKNGKKSMIIVALAGVVTNLFLSFLALNILYLLIFVVQLDFSSSQVVNAIFLFLEFFASINLTLCVFNLIPLPPLDGYKVIRELFCTWKNQHVFSQLDRYGNLILFALLILGTTNGIVQSVVNWLFNGMTDVLNLIYSAYL